MPEVFPIQKLYRAGVVVWDPKEAVRNYTEVYGIRDWRVFHFVPDRIADSSFYGRTVSHGYSSAVGETPGGAITFELIQPGPGAGSYKHFLYSRGEGVHHLLLHVSDRQQLRELRDEMTATGVREVESGELDRAVRYSIFDTRELLGGYHLKAVATDGGDFDAAIEPDERWDVSGELSWEIGGPLEVPSLGHFGIVVRDVVGKAESYSKLFGLDSWNFGCGTRPRGRWRTRHTTAIRSSTPTSRRCYRWRTSASS